MDQISNLFGGNNNQTYIPPFTSEGGTTPEQMALADYTGGQGHVAQANLFGTSGTGHSTMATQGAGGVEFGKAKELGSMSDINQGAQYALYQNDVQSSLNELAAENANQGAQSNALGKLIGGAFGTGGGSFGGGSNLGSTIDAGLADV